MTRGFKGESREALWQVANDLPVRVPPPHPASSQCNIYVLDFFWGIFWITLGIPKATLHRL